MTTMRLGQLGAAVSAVPCARRGAVTPTHPGAGFGVTRVRRAPTRRRNVPSGTSVHRHGEQAMIVELTTHAFLIGSTLNSAL